MSGQGGSIVVNGSVAGYFKEQLDALCAARRVELTDGAGFYVVNLLSDFAQADRLFLPSEDARTRDLVPLVELMARAAEATGEERVKLLRHLADSSLYIGGFFQDALEARRVDVGYYVSMGGGAYTALSGALPGREQQVQRDVFRELAEKFARLVELLAEMAQLNAGLAQSAKHVLRTYERWLETGSARLGSALRRQGIIFAGGVEQ
ncbi:MAG: hypothetical protein HY904_14900 [Deltaproteobacteria bacterium]|nr:hypothetical protein [Deltaproteobacteria bacterium]